MNEVDNAERAMDGLEYYRPEDVPEVLSTIEKGVIALRNIKAWAAWWESEAVKPPPIGGELTDVGDQSSGEGTG